MRVAALDHEAVGPVAPVQPAAGQHGRGEAQADAELLSLMFAALRLPPPRPGVRALGAAGGVWVLAPPPLDRMNALALTMAGSLGSTPASFMAK